MCVCKVPSLPKEWVWMVARDDMSFLSKNVATKELGATKVVGVRVERERKGIQQSNGGEYNYNTLYICMKKAGSDSMCL